jgi:hypothetical protein
VEDEPRFELPSLPNPFGGDKAKAAPVDDDDDYDD